MTLTRIHHLGLTVTDADASAAWYSEVLGFRADSSYQSPNGSRRKVFLVHDQLNVRLGLTQHTSASADRFDETRPGLDHLAFGVASVEDLLDWSSRLDACGVIHSPPAPANTIASALVLVLRDPDNIQLELIAIR